MNPTTDTNAATPSRQDAEKIENVLASGIIDAAIEVHRSLGGPGLLESLYSVHKAQVLTYLHLTKLKLGLLLNFGQKFLCDGIDRVVNDL